MRPTLFRFPSTVLILSLQCPIPGIPWPFSIPSPRPIHKKSSPLGLLVGQSIVNKKDAKRRFGFINENRPGAAGFSRKVQAGLLTSFIASGHTPQPASPPESAVLALPGVFCFARHGPDHPSQIAPVVYVAGSRSQRRPRFGFAPNSLFIQAMPQHRLGNLYSFWQSIQLYWAKAAFACHCLD